jgi:hypothetical protein
LDSPKLPWQEAHLASQTSSPWATLPLPGRRPLKSGRTSMSQAWISAGVAAADAAVLAVGQRAGGAAGQPDRQGAARVA